MTIVCTPGDCNGIGPEVMMKGIARYVHRHKSSKIHIICPGNVFDFYYQQAGAEFLFSERKNETGFGIRLHRLPDMKITHGKISARAGKSAYTALEAAKILLLERPGNALVTGPISKAAISLSHPGFIGHTELLASWIVQSKHLMVFHSKIFIGALATIHIPLSRVSKEITCSLLKEKLEVFACSLSRDFRITMPRIALLGVNPHAGECGLLGTEEQRIFKKLKSGSRYHAAGPFPADAFFGTRLYRQFDGVLAMYHDQLLAPFKLLAMKTGVNYTAGLPFVRTSPDHGTGFDIAGKNCADPTSYFSAIKLAARIQRNRELHEKQG